MKVSASVYMEVKVIVHVGDWEAAQSFEGLHQQASREARQKLASLFIGKSNHVEVSLEPCVMKVVTKELK